MEVRGVSISLESLDGLKSKFEVLKTIVKAGLSQGLAGEELKQAVSDALEKTNVNPQELVSELVSSIVDATTAKSWLSSFFSYFSFFKSCVSRK